MEAMHAPKLKHYPFSSLKRQMRVINLLFAHHFVTCLLEKFNFFAAALYNRSLSVAISLKNLGPNLCHFNQLISQLSSVENFRFRNG